MSTAINFDIALISSCRAVCRSVLYTHAEIRERNIYGIMLDTYYMYTSFDVCDIWKIPLVSMWHLALEGRNYKEIF